MTKILDAHSHFMPHEVAQNTAFFKVNWSDTDRQLSVMDEQGIEQAMLLYPTSDAHLNMGGWQNVCDVYNEEIGNVVKANSERFIGGGIVPVDTPENIASECERIKNCGLKFFSLASSYDGKYLDDEMFLPVFEFAQTNHFPIHVHSQIINPIGEERVRDPLLSPVLEYVFDVTMCLGKLMMEGILEKYKDVKIIFAHYGGVLPIVKERFDNTYQMLRSRDFVKDLGKQPGEYFQNLYFDTSGSQSPNSLLCALEVVNSTNILFGSDFPANMSLAQSIETIQSSSLPDTDKENILSGNFESIFNPAVI